MSKASSPTSDNASAAGESAPALRAGRGVVELVVVVEDRLVRLGELLAVLLDVGRALDLCLGDCHLQIIGTDLDPAQRHKRQVPADEALLHGAELGLVGLNVDVNVLQLSDPLAVAINQHLAVPLGDVPLRLPLVLGHRLALSRSRSAGIILPRLASPQSGSTGPWAAHR